MTSKIYNSLSILYGVAMAIFGSNKFFNFMPMPKDLPENIMKVMDAMVATKWIMPLVGIGEVLGGILIAIPKTRALGAIVMFPISVGILVHTLTHSPESIGMAAVFFLINVWIIWTNRDKYMPMIS
jgi:putative oxidoreductase